MSVWVKRVLKAGADEKTLIIPKNVYSAIALMGIEVEKGYPLKMMDISRPER